MSRTLEVTEQKNKTKTFTKKSYNVDRVEISFSRVRGVLYHLHTDKGKVYYVPEQIDQQEHQIILFLLSTTQKLVVKGYHFTHNEKVFVVPNKLVEKKSLDPMMIDQDPPVISTGLKNRIPKEICMVLFEKLRSQHDLSIPSEVTSLHEKIQNQTCRFISYSTVKRFYGMDSTTKSHNFELKSLDTLAIYLGYDGGVIEFFEKEDMISRLRDDDLLKE